MKLGTAIFAVSALSLAIVACSGGQQRRGPPPEIIQRALSNAPGAAQPSTIVATEVAFARDAKEAGQWTAFERYAAEGALVHTLMGPVPAIEWLGALEDPAEANEWGTRAVVMSCDGALAASMGRFVDPQGIVGNYVTVWERQQDLSYRWVHHAAGPDVPQPPPRRQFEDGEIVVTAIDSVKGLVASCPRGGQTIPPPPALSLSGDLPSRAELSTDGTMRWRWEHQEDGTKFIAAEYFYEGAWETGIEESLASAREE
ncbi:MAG: hypothetical protein AAGE86_11680 [Pseudomonadota bacterium]